MFYIFFFACNKRFFGITHLCFGVPLWRRLRLFDVLFCLRRLPRLLRLLFFVLRLESFFLLKYLPFESRLSFTIFPVIQVSLLKQYNTIHYNTVIFWAQFSSIHAIIMRFNTFLGSVRYKPLQYNHFGTMQYILDTVQYSFDTVSIQYVLFIDTVNNTGRTY